LAEWLYEAGIGEARAALVEDGAILQARIELDETAPRLGAVLAARLIEIIVKGREGRVRFEGGEAMLAPLPPGITQGSALTIEITREAVREAGRDKLPRAVPAEGPPRAAPSLLERIGAGPLPVRMCLPHQSDAFEAAGWSEVLEEATTGDIAFPGGALRMIPTPAMTLFDVDGSGPLEPLALAAAQAVAAAIVRHDIGGSIGIDFPTIAGKGPRQAVAEAIDAGLPQPFERTAVNGFGFLQIIRKRSRESLPELLRADPAATRARALLRAIERTPPPVPALHHVSAAVHAALAARPHWRDALARRTGADIRFEVR